MAKYNDVGDRYKYQKELERAGYKMWHAFTSDNMPEGFDCPDTLHGWPMRNAIKKWAEQQWFEDYRIVRANGYWKDLHGDYVYEIWINKKEYKNWLQS